MGNNTIIFSIEFAVDFNNVFYSNFECKVGEKTY